MRLIKDTERFAGSRVTLRLLTISDCTQKYVAWLQDPVVTQYLETRWVPQSLSTVHRFVESLSTSFDSYLFGIFDNVDSCHIGNIKLGPINHHHLFADISYFIGERDRWGRGAATDAICLVSQLGFARLRLHRIQAGVYRPNRASCIALERAGFVLEAVLPKKLRDGTTWCDQMLYGRLSDADGA